MFDHEGPTLVELARQALCSTRGGYDLLAPKFDRTPFRTPDWLLDAVAPLLGAPGSVACAVDLCCGTGAGLRILRPLCRDLLVGVDFSLGMLARARARATTHDATGPAAAMHAGASPRVSLVQQDVLALGFRERFELATIWGALGHLRPADQRRFLAETRSCLAPGGRLAFVTARWPPWWSPQLWLAAAFDGILWLRNRLWRPQFIMYYLSWPLDRSLRLLRASGFTTEALPVSLRGRQTRLRLVVATRSDVSPQA